MFIPVRYANIVIFLAMALLFAGVLLVMFSNSVRLNAKKELQATVESHAAETEKLHILQQQLRTLESSETLLNKLPHWESFVQGRREVLKALSGVLPTTQDSEVHYQFTNELMVGDNDKSVIKLYSDGLWLKGRLKHLVDYLQLMQALKAFHIFYEIRGCEIKRDKTKAQEEQAGIVFRCLLHWYYLR